MKMLHTFIKGGSNHDDKKLFLNKNFNKINEYKFATKITSSASILLRKYVKNHKQLLMITILLVIVSIIILSIYFPESLCNTRQKSSLIDLNLNSIDLTNSYVEKSYNEKLLERLNIDKILLHKFNYDYEDFERFKSSKLLMTSFDEIFPAKKNQQNQNNNKNSSQIRFDLNGNDVLVFLHMQKTGGSAFDRHLVRDLNLSQPCKCETKRKKKCRCLRPGTSNKYWLFSRYSIGWKCGLHADYTELTNCVDRILNQMEYPNQPNINLKRNYFFVTLVRNPILRFLSEFKHVQRGATWKTSRHWCDGRLPTRKEIQLCFNGPNWSNVTLDEFMSCPHNLAFNRQTRMLADLNLIGCYNKSFMNQEQRDSILLFSAKENLRKMAMFGLCEEQIATQYMFEKIFGLNFLRSFVQFDQNQTHSQGILSTLSRSMIEKIRNLNYLDMKLYSYAKRLFRQRFVALKSNDENFEQYYMKLIRDSRSKQRSKSLKFIQNRRDHLSKSIAPTTPITTSHGLQSDEQIDDTLNNDYDEQSPSSSMNDSIEDYYN